MSARKPQAKFGWHGPDPNLDSKAIEVGDCVSETRNDGLAFIGGEVEDHTWHNLGDLKVEAL